MTRRTFLTAGTTSAVALAAFTNESLARVALLVGATVVLVSETKGTKSSPEITNSTGDYVIPNVTADVYSVEISMDHSIDMHMLFDPGHSLDERILREQFAH